MPNNLLDTVFNLEFTEKIDKWSIHHLDKDGKAMVWYSRYRDVASEHVCNFLSKDDEYLFSFPSPFDIDIREEEIQTIKEIFSDLTIRFEALSTCVSSQIVDVSVKVNDSDRSRPIMEFVNPIGQVMLSMEFRWVHLHPPSLIMIRNRMNVFLKQYKENHKD